MSSLQGFFQTSVHGRFRNIRANNTEYTIIIRELPFNTGWGIRKIYWGSEISFEPRRGSDFFSDCERVNFFNASLANGQV